MFAIDFRRIEWGWYDDKREANIETGIEKVITLLL